MQSTRHFQLVFKKGFDLHKLAEVTFVFHQWQMQLYIAENIGDTAGIQGTEVQIEWEFRILRHEKTTPDAFIHPDKQGRNLHMEIID